MTLEDGQRRVQPDRGLTLKEFLTGCLMAKAERDAQRPAQPDIATRPRR